MNKSYKSIWNDTLGTYVAAAETASSSGRKVSSGRKARKLPLRAHAGQLVLEPRIVFDAALPATMAEVQQNTAQDLLLLEPLDALESDQAAVEAEAAESEAVPAVDAVAVAKPGEEKEATTSSGTSDSTKATSQAGVTEASGEEAGQSTSSELTSAVVTTVATDVLVADAGTAAATASTSPIPVVPTVVAEAAETKTVAEVVAEAATPVAVEERVEIIFVDAVVKAPIAEDTKLPVEVHYIDSSRDGIEQIAEVLKTRTDVDAIHIISHGDVGILELGSSVVDEQSITTKYSEEFEIIRAALAENADILLYGCDVGAAENGRSFIAALAEATGADVAASTDDTGASAAGGDWTLEAQTGAIETATMALTDMAGLLATPVAASNGNGALLAVIGRTIYSVNTETGKVFALTTAPATVGGVALSAALNSIAVNQAAGLIYYTDNEISAANKAVFAYDFKNDTHFVVDADVTDNGILLGNKGVGSGGATFANVDGVSTLFLGVEENGSLLNPVGSITDDTIYRIKLSEDGRTFVGQATEAVRIASGAEQQQFGDLAYDFGATNSSADDRLLFADGEPGSEGVIVYNPNTGALIATEKAFATSNFYQLAETQDNRFYAVASGSFYQLNPATGGLADGAAVLQLTTDGTAAVGGVVADAASWVPPTSTIGDLVFNDNDLDGVFDAGLDTGVEGVKVELFDDINNNGVIDGNERLLATATTDSKGEYTFSNVLPGDYLVRVSGTALGNGEFTTPGTAATKAVQDVTVNKIGSSNLGVDFGVDINDAPVAKDNKYTVVEDTKFTGNVITDTDATSGTDSDIDNKLSELTVVSFTVDTNGVGPVESFAPGETATIKDAGGAAIGDLTLAKDGSLTFVPATNYFGPVPLVKYTIQDTDGATSTATVTLGDVKPVNDPPVAKDNKYTVVEDTPLTGNVITDADPTSGTDSDIDNKLSELTVVSFKVDTNGDSVATDFTAGQSAEIKDAAGQAIGVLSIGATGALTFTPALNYNGPVPTATYTIKDPEGKTSSANVIFDPGVTPVNDAPVANDNKYTVVEDTTFKANVITDNDPVSGIDSDVDNKLSELTVVSFAVDIDGDKVNNEFTAGQSATIKNSAGETVGVLTIESTGALTFVPAPNYNGPVPTVTYTIKDPGEKTDSANVIFDPGVTPVNDAPVANDNKYTVVEDTTFRANVITNNDPVSGVDSDVDNKLSELTLVGFEVDADGDKVNNKFTAGESATIKNAAGETVGVLTLESTGALTFVPAPNYNGPVPTATYTIKDPEGKTSSANVIFDPGVTPEPDAPEGKDADRTIQEDTTYTFVVDDFGFSDNDKGDTLKAVSITTVATDGKLQLNGTNVVADQLVSVADIAAGKLVFVPDANEFGTLTNVNTYPYANFTFKVQDQTGLLDPVANKFTLNVTPLNDTPVAVEDKATTTEDSSVKINVLVNDNDNDPQDVLTVKQINGVDVTVNGPAVKVTDPNGASLGTVQLISQDKTQPQLLFTPEKNYNGDAVFKYTLTDGIELVQTTVTVTVTPVNDAPVANPDTTNTPEDTTKIISVLPNDTDVDTGDKLTVVSATPSDKGGTTVVNADNTISYTPAKDFVGTDTFTYTIKDSGGLTSTTTVTVNVGEVNDPPVANPDTDTTTQNATLVREEGNGVIKGAGADTDPDKDSLTVTAVKFGNTVGAVGQAIQGDWGTLTLKADGGYTYVPNAKARSLDDGQSQVDTFTYTVSDTGNASASTTLKITVTGLNDPPLAADDFETTKQDTPVTVNVLANDDDPDTADKGNLKVTEVNGTKIDANTPVSVLDATNTKIGTVTLEPTGQLKFTPEPLYKGAAIFDYTVSDGTATDTARVSIAVADVNDAPIADDDVATTDEDSAAFFNPLANDDDPDVGDKLTITQVNGTDITLDGPAIDVGNGTVQLVTDNTNADGVSFKFVPDANFTGTQTFEYTIKDSRPDFLTDKAIVTVTVVSVNDAPEGKDADRTIQEDTTYTFVVDDFGFSDNDKGDTLKAVSITTVATDGKLQLNGTNVVADQLVSVADIAAGKLVFVPDANEFGTLTNVNTYPYANFTFKVQDQTGLLDPVANKFTLNVTPLNDTPVAVEDKATTTEDSSVKINVLVNDNDNDPQDVLTVKQINGVDVTVNGPAVKVTDPNGASLGTVQLISQDKTQPQLLFTPEKNYNGDAVFKYTLTDGIELVQTTVTVTVTPVNDAPVANPDTTNTPEDTTKIISVLPNDTDVDTGDKLTVVSATPSDKGGTTVVNADNTISYTPAKDFVGTDTFTYTIKDSGGLTSTTTVTVNVGEVNDPPVANPDTDTTTQNATLVREEGNGVIKGAGADTDPDKDSLTVTAVKFGNTVGAVGQAIQGDWGTLTLKADGGYTYVPNAKARSLDDGQSQVDTFTYTVSDTGNASASTTLKITVTGLNDPPLAADDFETTKQDTPVTVNVLANDDDPDTADKGNLKVTEVNGTKIDANTPVSVLDATNTKIGTVTLEPTGQLKFTPEPLYKGAAIFDYTVSDGTATDTARVSIAVADVNDAPIADDDVATTDEDSAAFFNPLANDDDPDVGDKLTITQVNGTDITLDGPAIDVGNGTVQLVTDNTNADGVSFKFVPDANFTGTQTFEYTIKDSRPDFLTDKAIVTVTVVSVNDPPVFVDPNKNPLGDDVSVSTKEDTPISDKLNATDLDGDPLTFSLTTGPTNGNVVVNKDGTWTYTPNKDYNGPDVFDVQVSDGKGGVDTLKVNVTVTPENDPPVFKDPNGNPLGNDTSVTTKEDTPISDKLIATDVDGDPLTFSLTTGPTNGNVVVNKDGTWTYTPNKDYNGPDVFDVQVSDGKGGVDTLKVNVTVTPDNDPPTFVDPNGNPLGTDISVTTPQDTPVDGNLVAKDVDNDPLTFSLNALPANGTAVVNPNGSWTYTPGPGFSGQDTFTVVVSDGKGGVDSLRVNITVTPVAAPAPEPEAPPPPPPPAPPQEPLRGPDAAGLAAAEPTEAPELPPLRTGLFVLYAVGDAAAEQSATSTTGLATLDLAAPLFGEALGQLPDGLIYESSSRGQPLGPIQEPAFGEIIRVVQTTPVQNSVRHVSIGGDSGLFVQLAVRASQLESTVRSAMVDSQNSAVAGYSSLQDPFALGAPQVLGSAGTQVAEIETVPEQRTAVAFKPAEVEQKSAVVHDVPEKATPEAQKAAMGFRSQIERFAKDRQQSARPITRSATVKS